jgi:hypothetical protein
MRWSANLPGLVVIDGGSHWSWAFMPVIGKHKLSNTITPINLLPCVIDVCDWDTLTRVISAVFLGMNKDVRIPLQEKKSRAIANGIAPLVERVRFRSRNLNTVKDNVGKA